MKVISYTATLPKKEQYTPESLKNATDKLNTLTYFAQGVNACGDEGIVETSSWFGPLFINVRLTRTHHPIEFDPNFPFLQVQPLPREAYGAAAENFSIIDDLSGFGEADWNDFRHTIVRPNKDPHRKLGDYAVSLRKTQRAKERDDPTKE